jgi:hypothetical protein
MAHWAIYVAYAWLGTIIFAFTDAVQAIREGPRPKPQPLDTLQPQLTIRKLAS